MMALAQQFPALAFLTDRAARRRILLVVAVGAALTGLYDLLAPNWYRSTLSVVPASAPKAGGLSTLLGGSDLAGLAAGFEGALGGADTARISAVLESNAVTDAVIAKFDLRTRYREKHQEDAREALWKHCDIKTLPKPNIVRLSCEDKDPQFVRDMLNYFAEYGNQVFRRVGVSGASEEVRFLEGRVAELRQEAEQTSQRMREFQEKHRIVDLDTQARAVVSSLATLHSQRIAKELELDYARTFSSRDEAMTQQLRSQLSVMGEKFHDLEQPSDESVTPAQEQRGVKGGKDATGIFPAALAVPKLRAEYEGIFRDRKVAEATLVFALQRLEGAKANAARDVSTFLVLDPPAMPENHSRPRRLKLFVTVTLLFLMVGLAFQWWQSTGYWLMQVGGPASPSQIPSSDHPSSTA